MDRRQMCVSNLKYRKPGDSESRRSKNLLKYLTYRESRDQASLQVSGHERWIDHGMGRSVRQIADRCEACQSEHVLLFSLVINPNPDLMAMVELQEREQFVGQLTRHTVEDFFVARGIDTGVEWSAVLHHRQTDKHEPGTPSRHNPHAHVVLPGTYYHADEGRRVPLYFSQKRDVNHIELLHQVTQQNMAQLMEHYVGLDWEQRYDREHSAEPERPGIEAFDLER